MISTDNRQSFLDIAKGIGIILMLFGHVPNMNHVVYNFIFMFHMPLFFFVTGYLWKDNESLVLVKKLKKIILPYIYSSLVVLVVSFLYLHNFTEVLRAFLLVKTAPPILNYIQEGQCGPLWFLPCYFFTTMIASILLKSFNPLKLIIIAVTIFSFFFIISRYLGLLPFTIFQSSGALIFLLSGIIYKNHGNLINNYRFLLVSMGLISAVICLMYGQLSMASFVYKLYLLQVVSAVFLCIGLLKICSIIKHSRFFEFISRNSITILCIHGVDYCIGFSSHIRSFFNMSSISQFFIYMAISISTCYVLSFFKVCKLK